MVFNYPTYFKFVDSEMGIKAKGLKNMLRFDNLKVPYRANSGLSCGPIETETGREASPSISSFVGPFKVRRLEIRSQHSPFENL